MRRRSHLKRADRLCAGCLVALEETVKYSYDALVYYGETIAQSFERVARYGYDAIELVGEPANHDVAEI